MRSRIGYRTKGCSGWRLYALGIVMETEMTGIFPSFLTTLSSQKNIFLTALTGLALVHMSFKDKWGWGISDPYSAAKGYLELQQNSNDSRLPPAIWKSVRSPFCIPKVIFSLGWFCTINS